MSISARKVIKRSSGFQPLKILIILLVLSGLLWIGSRPAQASNLGENIPLSIVDGSEPIKLQGEDQQNPTVVALPDKNKWLVVWEDWRNWNATGADIYGRFIDENGDYCGNEFIICNQAGNQTMPTLAYRPAGTVLVAWQDSRGSTNSGFLYYKTIDVSFLAADGSGYQLSGETAVSYNSIDGDNLLSRKLPKAAYDAPRNQFWLVWIESRDQLQRLAEDPFDGYGSPYWHFGDSNYISFTTVAADTGNVAVPEILRNTGGSSLRTVRKLSSESRFDETSGTVTYIYEYFTNVNNVTVTCDDSSAETLIAWEGIRGQATLTCNWEDKDEEKICYTEGEGEEAKEVCYTNGNYGRPTNGDLYSSELKTESASDGAADGMVHIYAIFDKNISQPVVHSQLIDTSAEASHYPALGYDPIHRKFLVAWEEQEDSGFSKIYGQLLFSGGGLYGPNLLLSFQDLDEDGAQDDNIALSNQTRPQISVDTTNQRFFVTWQDGRNSQISVENLDIYGQFVDSEGSLRGYNHTINIARGNQYGPQTAYNRGTHQFFSVWKDARNRNDSQSDIYGQRYDLGQPQLMLLDSDHTQLTPPLLDFGALRTGESSTLSITLFNAGDATVRIDHVTDLPAPYAYKDLPIELENPDDGLTIDLLPGSSINLNVEFNPLEEGTFIKQFTISSDAGKLIVNLQGLCELEQAAVQANQQTIDFGQVGIGSSLTTNLILTNTGNVDLQITAIDSPPSVFDVSGLEGLTLGKGESRVIPIIFTPAEPIDYSGTLRILYDYNLEATEINLAGSGSYVHLSPTTLDFPLTAMDANAVKTITISNTSAVTMEVKDVGTATKFFTLNGIAVGDEIPPGTTITFRVTFSPGDPGKFNDILFIDIGPPGENEGSKYYILLRGSTAGDNIFYETQSFTADRNYRLKINAFTDQPGQLYVLLAHIPVSGNTIYAVTSGGNIVPFPYDSPSNWQNLYYATNASPTMEVDLSGIDLRQIGCTTCQGPSLSGGSQDNYLFGTVPVNSPVNETYNCADDFKYLGGNLYLATYLADGVAGTPFDFNRGLLELQQLNINSLGGSWQVTSAYDGQGRKHADLLQVQEENGNISATWSPKYSNLMIRYSPEESAYLLTFNIGAYNYVYKITSLDADRFSGTYACTVNGEVVAKDQPVCGVRENSGLTCNIPNIAPDDNSGDDENSGNDSSNSELSDNGNATSNAGSVFASFSGNGIKNTQPFTTTGPWEVRWSTSSESGLFSLYLYDADGNSENLVRQPGSGEGSSYYPKAGKYYFSVISDGSWKIDIVPKEQDNQ